MRNTKLILIEGLPGAGKSTTTGWLHERLGAYGVEANCYREDDVPHPIPCLDFEIKGLPEKVLPLWETFISEAAQSSVTTVIESRLWQNTCLYMLMSEIDTAKIVEFAHKEEEVVAPLSPVLIYLDQSDTKNALERLYPMRGKTWMDSTLEELLSYPWFTKRKLNDFEGCVKFFEEWRALSNRLFDDWHSPKLRILDPYKDWVASLRMIEEYLTVK